MNTHDLSSLLSSSSSLLGVLSAIGFILVLCVKPLRTKFTEYIILKHNNPQQLQHIQELQTQVIDLTDKIKQLEQQILTLSTALASCKALLSTIAPDADVPDGRTIAPDANVSLAPEANVEDEPTTWPETAPDTDAPDDIED